MELAGRRLQLIGLNTPIWSQVNRSASREEETNVNVVRNSNPGSYIKRTSIGGIKFILTSMFEERGCRCGEWTHMCRFYLYDLIWSVYLYMICLCCENVKI